MLCEKCGKMNDKGVLQCAHCGSPMPERSGCGGFGDILDYESVNATQTVSKMQTVSVDNGEIKKLTKQIFSLKKALKRTILISLISLLVGIIALSVSVINIIWTPESDAPVTGNGEPKEQSVNLDEDEFSTDFIGDEVDKATEKYFSEYQD